MSKRIGIVFPGYGQQFIGMGKDLYDELRIVQEFFEQAAAIADVNFVKLLFASSDEEVFALRKGYLAVLLFEASLYEVLHRRGLKPDFIAGYGIGEYAAAYASGSLPFSDAFYLLNKYAQFYEEFLKDKDYTVLRIIREFDVESIEELCQKMSTVNDQAYVAAQNTKHAFYVAGALNVIEKIQDYCLKEVIRKVRMIGPGYEMHSCLVDEVVERLKLYYHKIQFKPLAVPVITNVDGVYVTTPDALESAMIRKINTRIQWLDVIKGFEGCDVVISVGPGDQLIEWFKEVYPDKEYYMVASLKDIESIGAYFFSPLSNNQLHVENGKKDLYESDLLNEEATDFDIDDDEDYD